MKKIVFFITMLALSVVITACTATKSPGEKGNNVVDVASDLLDVDEDGNTKFNGTILSGLLNEVVAAELTAEEIEGIKFMMEEEKLARDVYIKLYEKWKQQNFNNISQSEGTHINAIRSLAEKYNVDISFYNDEVGQFTNEDLMTLYNDLVSQGEGSLTEALNIGALIEEIDILDLEKFLKQSDNQDIDLVYNNLIKGSRNHLRSFTRTMTRQGQKYEPQRLGNAVYEEIISSDIERGSYGQKRSGGQQGRGQMQKMNR